MIQGCEKGRSEHLTKNELDCVYSNLGPMTVARGASMTELDNGNKEQSIDNNEPEKERAR